jgi:hypothetical protein
MTSDMAVVPEETQPQYVCCAHNTSTAQLEHYRSVWVVDQVLVLYRHNMFIWLCLIMSCLIEPSLAILVPDGASPIWPPIKKGG